MAKSTESSSLANEYFRCVWSTCLAVAEFTIRDRSSIPKPEAASIKCPSANSVCPVGCAIVNSMVSASGARMKPVSVCIGLPSGDHVRCRYVRNGLPTSVKVSSSVYVNELIVGYSPRPGPRQVPMSEAIGFKFGCNAMPRS